MGGGWDGKQEASPTEARRKKKEARGRKKSPRGAMPRESGGREAGGGETLASGRCHRRVEERWEANSFPYRRWNRTTAGLDAPGYNQREQLFAAEHSGDPAPG